jgi:hypothetical protein
MTYSDNHNRRRHKLYKPLTIVALCATGFFNIINAVLAESAPAGTSINNRATATYSDGSTSYDAISNTVTVKMSEVSGLTVVSDGFNNTTDSNLSTGDVVTFDFLVTNVGNAPTYVFVPGLSNLTPTGGTISSVQIVNNSGTVLGTVPNAGASTQTILASQTNAGVIGVNENFRVRVTMTVTTTTANAQVGVVLGNTLDNVVGPLANGTQGQQSIPDLSESSSPLGAANTNDLRTLNFGTESPINGESEAAASTFQTATPIKLAQALVLKSIDSVSNNSTPSTVVDDTITYNLAFNILNNASFDIEPEHLEGTNITLNGTASPSRILIADAIPVGTVWDGVTPTAPNANWTPVYSTDDPAVAPGNNPLEVNWIPFTTAPASNAAVKRIGFVYNAATNGTLAPGFSLTGFKFTVVTSGLPATGGTVANITQIFGETRNDVDNKIVYDESGDQSANNLDSGDPPGVSDFDPNTDLGIANANDPDGDQSASGYTPNQGSGTDGESNVITLTAVTPGQIRNGPQNNADAIGPTNNNDDFTNKATTVTPIGLQGEPGDPAVTTIVNTLLNPASAGTVLNNIKLAPIAPSTAQSLTGNNVYGADNELPNGTLVTIRYDSQTVNYEYTSGIGFHTVGNSGTVPNPVVVGTITSGASVNYDVDINLPAGTAQISGYEVPILAFADDNGNNALNPAVEPTFNITINRVYPGYVTLLKEARVYRVSGSTTTELSGGFTSNQTVLDAIDILAGDFIEYRISYQNISTPQPSGQTGNVVLTANSLAINEDGVATGQNPNNWATYTTHRVGTAATLGTTAFFNGATALTASPEPANGTAVTRYLNSGITLAPNASGTFTFLRVVD